MGEVDGDSLRDTEEELRVVSWEGVGMKEKGKG